MGKAHSHTLRAVRELDPPLLPELVSLSSRNREAASAVADAIQRSAASGRKETIEYR